MNRKTWRAITVLLSFCIICVIAILAAASSAQAQTAILTPNDSGNIVYHGTGTPDVPVYLTISTTVSASTFSDSDAPSEKKIELYNVQVQSPYDFGIEVSPVTSLDVSGRWVFPIWVRIGGTVDINNVGSYSRSGTMANTYDIKIEATPADTDLSITITSMYVPDTNGDYTAVLNTAGIPDGVYSIKQGTEEIAKAYVGVDPPVTFQLDIKTGWNLMSIPLVMEDKDVSHLFPADVLENVIVVWAWDNTQQAYKMYTPLEGYTNTLSTIDESMGFWVYSTADHSFSVSGQLPADSDISLVNGWNLVGNPVMDDRDPSSVYSDYLVVWGWDRTLQEYRLYTPVPGYTNTLTSLSPGYGYWVYKQ